MCGCFAIKCPETLFYEWWVSRSWKCTKLNARLCTFYAQLQTLVRIRMSISLNSFLSLFRPKSVGQKVSEPNALDSNLSSDTYFPAHLEEKFLKVLVYFPIKRNRNHFYLIELSWWLIPVTGQLPLCSVWKKWCSFWLKLFHCFSLKTLT